MCVGIADQHIEDHVVEQVQHVGCAHGVACQCEHVGRGGSLDAGLVRLVLGGRWLSERLAEILLVQPAPPSVLFDAVVAGGHQVGALAGLARCHARGVEPAGPRQRQAQRLVLHAAEQAFGIGLQDVRRRRAVVGNADAALRVDGYAELVLHAGKRHRHAFLTDEERLARQLGDDAFQRLLVRNWLPAPGACRARLADGQRTRRVAADLGEDGDGILGLCAELASNCSELCGLGQQVGCPGCEQHGAHAPRRERHED